jgi:hypothetical protein
VRIKARDSKHFLWLIMAYAGVKCYNSSINADYPILSLPEIKSGRIDGAL